MQGAPITPTAAHSTENRLKAGRVRGPAKAVRLRGAPLSLLHRTCSASCLFGAVRPFRSAQRSFAQLRGRSRVPKPARRAGCCACPLDSEARTATGVTPSRLRRSRQLGCRTEAGPRQLQRKVRPPARWLPATAFRAPVREPTFRRIHDRDVRPESAGCRPHLQSDAAIRPSWPIPASR